LREINFDLLPCSKLVMSETLVNIIVKLPCDPSAFLLFCLNHSAAGMEKGFFRPLALGDVHNVPIKTH
jgi:hypothetical protein